MLPPGQEEVGAMTPDTGYSVSMDGITTSTVIDRLLQILAAHRMVEKRTSFVWVPFKHDGRFYTVQVTEIDEAPYNECHDMGEELRIDER